MAETIDELTYDYEDEGKKTREELDRVVLTKGSWSTIMFKFREMDRKTEDWKAPKLAIVRYQKRNGQYRKQSHFNISSEKQARQIVDAISHFFPDEDEEGAEE